MKANNLPFSVTLGAFLSTIAYMKFFHSGMNLADLIYIMISVIMLCMSLLLSNRNTSQVFLPLVLTCIFCAVGYSVLYVFLYIYKEIHGYSPIIELVLLGLTFAAFLVLIFHEKPSFRTMSRQLNEINFKDNCVLGVGITAIILALKFGLNLVHLDSISVEFLKRSLMTLWVIWSYVVMPLIFGSLTLLFLLRVGLKAIGSQDKT